MRGAGGGGQPFVFGNRQHQAGEALQLYVFLRFKHAREQGGGFHCAACAEIRHAEQAVKFRHGGAVFGRRGGRVHADVCPAFCQRRGGDDALHAVDMVLQRVFHSRKSSLHLHGMGCRLLFQPAQGGGEQIGRFQAEHNGVAAFAAVIACGKIRDVRGAVEIHGEIEIAFSARGDAGDFLHHGNGFPD